MSHRKRPHEDDGRRRRSLSPRRPRSAPRSPSPGSRMRSSFSSYRDASDLPPKTRLLCEIVAKTPSTAVEAALDDAGVRVTAADVEEVLKLSYAYPGAALKFFRWAGAQLNHNHSPYAWNLVVDLLGKNFHFDAMWDAVKSMRTERIISLATFASVFGSYAAARRIDDALMTFEVMDLYGVPKDVTALNSLLSAVCREGLTAHAREFLDRARRKMIAPDADSYAILLEGCENEGDAKSAREMFEEMIARVGWDPANVAAYDSFLTTLLKSRSTEAIDEAIQHLKRIREWKCSPGVKFFRNALDTLLKAKDSRRASVIWEMLAWRHGCYPDVEMYNTMIALLCYINLTDEAFKYMDEMLTYGVFPNAKTYNILLQFLLKTKKLKDATSIFNEMVKNECGPTHENCTMALKVYLDSDDMKMAIRIWKYMVDKEMDPLEETGNMLITSLRDADKLPEACRYAEDMAERGIKLSSGTLSKLRSSLTKLEEGALRRSSTPWWSLRKGGREAYIPTFYPLSGETPAILSFSSAIPHSVSHQFLVSETGFGSFHGVEIQRPPSVRFPFRCCGNPLVHPAVTALSRAANPPC
ncbi:hypothetical protein Taro_015291 [Colocasia esculenta]|uniref:Pentatricopeptide repeat-containing protein n=1 Tax=Colocasia esculenta TaxID=4460 RepID=A0A843UPH1_COLES|nr:hypothetical protein [Colocasia esculenta]